MFYVGFYILLGCFTAAMMFAYEVHDERKYQYEWLFKKSYSELFWMAAAAIILWPVIGYMYFNER